MLEHFNLNMLVPVTMIKYGKRSQKPCVIKSTVFTVSTTVIWRRLRSILL